MDEWTIGFFVFRDSTQIELSSGCSRILSDGRARALTYGVVPCLVNRFLGDVLIAIVSHRPVRVVRIRRWRPIECLSRAFVEQRSIDGRMHACFIRRLGASVARGQCTRWCDLDPTEITHTGSECHVGFCQ